MAKPKPKPKPIVALLDLLGKRWALRILWELRGDPKRFRDIQSALSDASPTVVNARLKELRAAKLIELDGEGYRLTDKGAELAKLVQPMSSLSAKWAKGRRQ